MANGDFREHRAEIGGDSQIAAIVEFVRRQAGPAAVHFTSADCTADHEKCTSVSVVRATHHVFACRATKFRERKDNDVLNALAEIGHQCCHCAREIVETTSELTI